jgi:hypothetical protein
MFPLELDISLGELYLTFKNPRRMFVCEYIDPITGLNVPRSKV